jgi:hypothetical protein
VLTSEDTATWCIDKPLPRVVGTYGKYDLVFLSGGDVAASTAGFCYVGGGMLSAPPHDNLRRFACLWTSLDGVDWSLPPYSPSLLGAGVLVDCRGVTWGPNGWIAVGAREEGGNLVSGPEAWHSTGGAVWEAAHPGDERPGYGGLKDVAASDALYVAVGFETPAPLVNEVDITPLVLTSPNGVTWTRHALGTAAETGGMRLDEVAHGPAGFLAIGTLTRNAMQSPVVWLSADGTSWQQVRLWPGADVITGYMNKFRSVAGGDKGYVIVGSRLDKPALWLSGDFAVDWEPSAASVDASGTP